MAMLMSGASLALGSGCGSAGTASPTAAATPGADTQRSAAASDGACFTGGESDIVQARVAVHDKATGELTSVVDVELTGPRRDALRACYAVVMRELELGAISRGVLRATVVRECSDRALARGALDAPAVLIDTRKSEAMTVVGIETLASDPRMACNLQAFEQVRVTTRRQSAYQSRESCEQARALLEQAMEQAALDARQAALGWLDRQLTEQRAQAEQACAGDAAAPGCATHRQLVEQLGQRRDELAKQAPEPPKDVSLVCQLVA